MLTLETLSFWFCCGGGGEDDDTVFGGGSSSSAIVNTLKFASAVGTILEIVSHLMTRRICGSDRRRGLLGRLFDRLVAGVFWRHQISAGEQQDDQELAVMAVVVVVMACHLYSIRVRRGDGQLKRSHYHCRNKRRKKKGVFSAWLQSNLVSEDCHGYLCCSSISKKSKKKKER